SAVGCKSAKLGVDASALPFRTALLLDDLGYELLDAGPTIESARMLRDDSRLETFRQAAALCDAAQIALKRYVEPGVIEATLCGLCQAEMNRIAGRRVPTFLNIRSGPESAKAPWEATSRTLRGGDLVLCDVAPWHGGVWGDSANTVVV